MLALDMVSWWYGPGWRTAADGAKHRLETVSDMFSVPILLRTLFAPWRRIITYPGKSLDEHLRAAVDNAVSRLIGFLVRLLVLVAAGVMLAALGLAGLLEVILWPFVPVLGVGLIVWGLL